MDGVLILPILLLLMYFMILRPQQKQRKQQQAMISTLDVGDDVILESGIYGTVSDLDGGTLFIMVADGVEIKVAKSTVARMISYDDDSELN
ncbi:preprotein translocase subunit YajC [bacterium]|nr:preprotein translocase subunit YajC [bacterium]|tara:strand:- start:575 stop:847 length:273 start_codon:yes stop_codon:yes gene_type:complete